MRDDTIDDGFGNSWIKCSPSCDMHVVRPGKAQCNCSNPIPQEDFMNEQDVHDPHLPTARGVIMSGIAMGSVTLHAGLKHADVRELADRVLATLTADGFVVVRSKEANTDADHAAEMTEAADRLERLANRMRPEARILQGIDAAQLAFDVLWSSGDWEDQVSIGFASTYAQELDQLRETVRRRAEDGEASEARQ